MIQQNAANENVNSELNISFIASIKELGISRLLSQCGVRKDSRKIKGEVSNDKRTAFEIFQFLLLMVFQGCNLYRFLGSKKQDIACSKSTYHRFLSNEHYNWKRFILLLAAKVTIFAVAICSSVIPVLSCWSVPSMRGTPYMNALAFSTYHRSECGFMVAM